MPTANCLANDPRAPVGGAVCGDRITSRPSEECDAGLGGSDLCTGSCTFKPGVECAAGDCCDLSTGQFRTVGTLCRAAMHECDLPDYCAGSATCGGDIFKPDGTECTEGGPNSRCNAGSCVGLDAQ